MFEEGEKIESVKDEENDDDRDEEKEIIERSNHEVLSIELFWEKCSTLFLNGILGDKKSIDELEELSKDGDVICLVYLLLLMERLSILFEKEKTNELRKQLALIISNTPTINSNYFLNLTNKYAQFIYGVLFEKGIGIEKNITESFRLFKLSAEQGYSLAQFNLATNYEDGFYITKDLKEAYHWYELSALQGFVDSQINLGYAYEFGLGVTQDYSLAFYWYEKASDLGDPDGQYNLGLCYLYGKGVIKNKEKGLELYKKASDQEFSLAQYFLGRHYINTDDIIKQKEGYQLIQKSANNGFSKAQFALGLQYYLGVGNYQVDEEEAIRWIQLSSKNKLSDASFFIGRCYYYGRILQKDRVKSIEFLEKAIVEGSSKAKSFIALAYFLDKNEASFNDIKGTRYLKQLSLSYSELTNEQLYNVGICYEYGLGFESFEHEAFDIFTELSDDDDAIGQYALGRCYEEGIGTEVDLEEANRLYTFAASQGNIDAQIRLIEYDEDKIMSITMNKKRKFMS